MSEELKCEATACHCDHMHPAKYIVTLCNGHEEKVSKQCALLHVQAGYKSRAIPPPEDV